MTIDKFCFYLKNRLIQTSQTGGQLYSDTSPCSVTHQMPIPVPSISCCVLNHHNLFYQRKNALAFNQDTCCHLALCFLLLPFHYLFILTKIFHENSASCGRKPIGRKTFDRDTCRPINRILNLIMLIGPYGQTEAMRGWQNTRPVC